MPVAAPPKSGSYYTDGTRLIRVLDVIASYVEYEDAWTYEIDRLKLQAFYADWRKVKKAKLT